MRINVVLADYHPTVIVGVAAALEPTRTIKVTGTASIPEETIELLQHVSCDVLVVDHSMSDCESCDGITFLSLLRQRYPELKIVVYSMIDSQNLLRDVAALGVHSCVSKADDLGQLISAIHAVHAHAIYYPAREIRVAPLMEMVGHVEGRMELSEQEAEVIKLYVSGMSINRIAAKLHESGTTISAVKFAAMKKLGIGRDAELFRHVWESGVDSAWTVPVAGMQISCKNACNAQDQQ